MFAYHVVTDRPVQVGQKLSFDGTHCSGVGQRVKEKADEVIEIYRHPERYRQKKLEHHTSVALRELAMEEVRRQKYPYYPSRLNCLYVSGTLEEAEQWAQFFARIGRPTYSIVKVKIDGRCFVGNAANCFDGTPDRMENLKLAERYWENRLDETNGQPVYEILADGIITVTEVIAEIMANIASHNAGE